MERHNVTEKTNWNEDLLVHKFLYFYSWMRFKCSWELSGFRSAPVFSITYGLDWDFAGLKKAVVLEFALCFYCHIVLDYFEVWSLMRYLSTFVGVAQQGSLYFVYLLYIVVFAWRQGHCNAVLAVLLFAGWLTFCSSMGASKNLYHGLCYLSHVLLLAII